MTAKIKKRENYYAYFCPKTAKIWTRENYRVYGSRQKY